MREKGNSPTGMKPVFREKGPVSKSDTGPFYWAPEGNRYRFISYSGYSCYCNTSASFSFLQV